MDQNLQNGQYISTPSAIEIPATGTTGYVQFVTDPSIVMSTINPSLAQAPLQQHQTPMSTHPPTYTYPQFYGYVPPPQGFQPPPYVTQGQSYVQPQAFSVPPGFFLQQQPPLQQLQAKPFPKHDVYRPPKK